MVKSCENLGGPEFGEKMRERVRAIRADAPHQELGNAHICALNFVREGHTTTAYEIYSALWNANRVFTLQRVSGLLEDLANKGLVSKNKVTRPMGWGNFQTVNYYNITTKGKLALDKRSIKEEIRAAESYEQLPDMLDSTTRLALRAEW